MTTGRVLERFSLWTGMMDELHLLTRAEIKKLLDIDLELIREIGRLNPDYLTYRINEPDIDVRAGLDFSVEDPSISGKVVTRVFRCAIAAFEE